MKSVSISIFIFIFFFLIATAAEAAERWQVKTENPEFLHRSIKKLTDVIVHDIYSPPVASRIYAYITIAGYEAAISGSPQYVSLAGQLHGLGAVPKPGKTCSYTLASVYAILTVGKAMVISEEKVTAFQELLLREFRNSGMPEEVFDNSVSYGGKVADHVLAWAGKDNYKQTRSYPKYDIDEDEHTWKPTPPAYMRAVEPHWNKIRTFILDSANQFKPLPPTPFSKDRNSSFYREALDVYHAGRKLTAEQQEQASFWDCNPFKMNVKGHVMYATKKISPGGHWINITRIVCRKVNAGFLRAAEAYASVSIVLADGFISCWDEKYRSNVIRPETFINEYIDGAWTPLLQTPPFPEYTSGHSVISTASAVVLTRLFGENFSFADSTEVEFGLPVRRFKSFKAAADEAAISRFYGGIHYMPSIKNGVEEGRDLGTYISRKLKTRDENEAVKISALPKSAARKITPQ